MKRISLLLTGLLMTTILAAQPWQALLPEDKPKQELTFDDYQKAFYDYWEPFNVKRGFYTNENGKKIKAHGWKQFKRWEWFWETEVDLETGTFPDVKPIKIFKEWKAQNAGSKSKSANWESMGPESSNGGYAGVGRINTIAFHPTDNDTYWIGAPSGGVWYTTDNGSNWTCLTDNNPVLGISDILIPENYTTTNTIYIATGDRDAWDNRSVGVLKSTDNGATWNSTALSYELSDNMMTTRLLNDPNDVETIIAATSGGVMKTTDGGNTWDNELTSASFIDMEFKPGDYSTLYGGTQSGQIYMSADSGQTWTNVLNTGHSRVELAVSPAADSIVYAIVANNNNGLYGIYRSEDSGNNFEQVFDGMQSGNNLLDWSQGNSSGGQGWYDLSIAASPVNADVLLIGGVNTWQSEDGGNNWELVNHWYGGFGAQAVHADKHMLKYRENGDLFECNDGGVYISLSDGDDGSWQDKTNGMVISQMYRLGVSATSTDEVITGLQDNGTKLTYNGTWEDVIGGDGMECLIDYSDEDIQYGALYYGQIERTTNHWVSSSEITPSGAANGAWVTPYVIDPNDPETLYAGYADVWKTTNRGDSWEKISNMSSYSKLRALAVAPSNSEVIYTADPGDIWRTTDGGENWNNITNGLPSNAITYITVKLDDPNTAWVTLGEYDSNAVYETTDGGTTWNNISEGLPELPAQSIVQNNLISDATHLYVGTRVGVYFKNGEQDWVAFNSNLPNVRIDELEIYYDYDQVTNSRLIAATYGRGLWKTPLEMTGDYPPSLATFNASDITMTSATLNGSVVSDFGADITESGFLAGMTSELTYGSENVHTYSTNPVITEGDFSTTIDTLQEGTTYYYRSYALNNNGTGYGSIKTFTTEVPPQYEITFIVEDAETNDGIYQAEIEIDDQTITTSPAGYATIMLGDGDYNYTVSADGYNDIVNETIEVAGSNQTVEISLVPVGITNMAEQDFDIYPNPAEDQLHITVNGKFTATLLNEEGKPVKQQLIENKGIFNLKDLPKGAYFVRLKDGNKQTTQKIIIK